MLLLVVSLIVIFGVWLEGHLVIWLLGDVGLWIVELHVIGVALASVHEWLGDAILWVVGLHVVAVLYHYFVLCDGVLLSMLSCCWWVC